MEPASSLGSELVAVLRQSLSGTILDCNAACAHLLGFDSREEILRFGRLTYVNESDALTVHSALHDLDTLNNVELALRRKDGTVAWVLKNMKVHRDGHESYVETAMFDVTEQRIAVQRIEHQAYHDTLTQLPNRMLFIDRLRVALTQSRRRNLAVAVLVIDLDRFADINTRYGRGIADRTIRAVADRLAHCLREEDSLARLGEDEFLALVEVRKGTDAAVAASRMMETLARPFNVAGFEIDLTASIGIAVTPSDGMEADVLVRNACTAMFQAKVRGRNRIQFHEPELNARALERASLISAIRSAFQRKEFELHYQPEVNVQTGRIECIEALLRWRHPDFGCIAAADFVDAAESGGLGQQLTEWVMREACRQVAEWRRAGNRDVRVAVNVSAGQIHDHDIQAAVERALAASHLDPQALELEIAEPTLVDQHRSMPMLRGLREAGVRIAVDDFGSGGCSFMNLKNMPVDTLKIAPEFIHNVTSRQDDAAIVQAIITMARGLNLRTVAEGVETKDQLSYLLNRQCTEMQGHFFGRPLPASALHDTLQMQH